MMLSCGTGRPEAAAMTVTSPTNESILTVGEELEIADGKVSPQLDVFEGPEKKLEIFFSPMTNASTFAAHAEGFRHFSYSTWADILADARCSILHTIGNEEFDAYLLSESSLFVYPSKLILKTCGTTTLLLVLPKVLALADELGMPLANVHYSHFRYAFPQLQPYPHSSFGEEQRTMRQMLKGRVRKISAKSIGTHVATGTAWFVLCADGDSSARTAMSCSDSIFEVAMEGISSRVCDSFFGSTKVHGGKTGRELALSMSSICGISTLVAGATIDDWAFEPCGYSMNALRGQYYYTVHVTPEHAFSYASFETNDPAFATAEKLNAIATTFEASSLTMTLTTRGSGGESICMPYLEDTTSATAPAICQITNEVSIQVCSFERVHIDVKGSEATLNMHAVQARAAASADINCVSSDEEQSSHAGSWADSELTAPLDVTRSEADDCIDSPVAKRAKMTFNTREERLTAALCAAR